MKDATDRNTWTKYADFSVVLLASSWLIFIQACSLHTVNPAPAPPVNVPATYGIVAEEEAPEDRWWESFEDPMLNILVEKTLQGNRTLHAGWARLKQMDAIGRQARSGLFPTFDAEATYNRSRANMKFGDFSSSFDQDRFALSVSAGYEVDLWKRVDAAMNAARTERRASREDLEAQAMTLAAQTVEIWFHIRALRAQLDSIDSQTELAETHLDALRFRFAQGFGTSVEISQQQERIAAIQSQKGPLKGQVQTLLHQLAVLTGSHPRTTMEDAGIRSLPSLPALPATGVPSDLLQNRPDVKAAQLFVVSADHRLGIAIADQFPTLRLGASFGFTSIDDLSSFLEDWVYSLLASFSGSVWDGGRKSAEVDRTRAIVEERMHLYGQTILNAMREVEDALVLESKQQEYVKALENQVLLAKQTESELASRFLGGLGESTPVLAARERIAQAEVAVLLAKRQQISYRVQLCRALGGGWTDALNEPTPVDTAKTQSAPAPDTADDKDATVDEENTEEKE